MASDAMTASTSSLSRPATPDFERGQHTLEDSEIFPSGRNSLDLAANTIDDLTIALANFSRVPSPEPPSLVTCCCAKEDCEHMHAWLSMKNRLESRLILSAEVGQALLQRHEAYVRRHELRKRSGSVNFDEDEPTLDEQEKRIFELTQERDTIERRLTQALVNNEITEVSNKTILQELQESKATITRLSTGQAKSIGWENRLAAAMKERDDMQQERDSESHRARLAESRFAALKDKTARLQADVRRLQDDLQDRRLNRLESSETLLQDARSQLEALQRSLSPSVASEQTELTKVLESLMDDNETLKRDNAELQHFLSESREEIHALQEEVEEHRASQPSRSGRRSPKTPTFRQHFHTGSMPSSSLREHMMERTRIHRPNDLLTPESHPRPLSPADSDSKWTSFSQPRVAYHLDVEDADDDATDEFERRSPRPLLLLSRSRAVQTDPVYIDRGLLATTPSPHDPRSETSSFSESAASNMAQLVERVSSLLNRMMQADALTLTNRLKRQHLHGADIGHLSRSTVNAILSEAAGLRLQFRALLDDDKVVTTCNRRDLRALLKLFREIFVELGQLRVTMNEIVLDPSIAAQVRELVMNPAKAEAEALKRQTPGNDMNGSGWMGPLSKLFGSVAPSPAPQPARNTSGLQRSVSGRAPQRFVPKLGPALSASATTVNVEFSGSGVGRAITTSTPPPSRQGTLVQPQPQASTSTSVMGIFAGAPARTATPDPWVVLPRGASSQSRPHTPATAATTSTLRLATDRRMSRNVDAIVSDMNSPAGHGREGDEAAERDVLGPLVERRLRRRGLSDSSIRSTFVAHESEAISDAGEQAEPSRGWPVLKALSRRVTSNLRAMSGAPATSAASDTERSTPSRAGSTGSKETSRVRDTEQFGKFMAIPGLSPWTGGEAMVYGESDLFGGSPPATIRSSEASFSERALRRDMF
ncbi:hypothetical protein CYLTODRAFT_435731 [Cylindrobasidium torrendii FP15055 ss-10]|uniref:Uncharacterized protein n=1 Tax=Cylindrobasidium torrendii FP15055 ss-10 TaxID=1314674 RepID=A0A0D7BIK7_9AGAR|nr:hypothetical protein CYLTODRAFT_435731 [Cylindrobasidium torrendii FP15055 ss-10]